VKRLHIWRSRLFLVGMSISIILVITSVFSPFLAPYTSTEFSQYQLAPPNKTFCFGTDEYGRDLFSRILRGGLITLSLSFVTVFFSGFLGISWGLLAAYTKGVAHIITTRAIDFLISFPAIIIALFVLSISGASGTIPLIIALSIAFCPRFARVIHGATLPILKEEYILAAKAIGCGDLRILTVHILPNLLGPITVLFSIYLPYVIILESSLSFLGLGAPPDVPTWGRIISDGKVYMTDAPWLTIFPGIAIIITALGFNLLGDGLRDLLDPRSATRLYK